MVISINLLVSLSDIVSYALSDSSYCAIILASWATSASKNASDKTSAPVSASKTTSAVVPDNRPACDYNLRASTYEQDSAPITKSNFLSFIVFNNILHQFKSNII